MTLISQSVDNFLGGVSQQDERLRDPTQLSEQKNCLSDPAHGLMKRPPKDYKAEITGSAGAYTGNDVSVHEIARDGDGEKYLLVIRNGDLKVFKKSDMSEMTVHTPNGTDYLSTGEDFRTLTLGNTTIVLNQSVEVDKLTTKQVRRDPEALVFVRQADYSTRYTIVLGNYAAHYVTPSPTNPEAREKLDTSEVMRELHNRLLEKDGFSDEFSTERLGSSLYIKRLNSEDFLLEVHDGLADKGLLSVKETVQRFEDLPLRAKEGFVCQVLGDPGTEFDNYWVVYDEPEDLSEEYGVWRETVQPGTPLYIDESTMPHELVLQGQFTEQGEARASLPQPIIRPAKVDLQTFAWDDAVEGGAAQAAVNADYEPELHAQDDEVELTTDSAFDGEETEIEVYYDADTTVVEPGVKTRLILEHDDGGGGSYEEIGFKMLPSGENRRGDSIRATITPSSGSKLRLKVDYSLGATPTNEHRRSRIRPKARRIVDENFVPEDWEFDIPDLPDRPPVQMQRQYAKNVLFGANVEYPGGFQITLTLDGTDPFNYTPSSTETGETVASALQALIDADGSYTASIVNPGEVQIMAGDGTSDVTVAYTTAFSEDTDVWLRELDLNGLTLTGATVRNLSDGSEGTISSHSDDSISVSSLTGGEDNKFQRGDIIDIVQSGTYWVFRPGRWRGREVGSLETNPFPTFVDEKITDVGFYQNRLIFVYKDEVHTTGAGDLVNLFRNTSQAVRADDPIAAQAATEAETIFHAAIEWDKQFYLISEAGPVLFHGDPVLTPSTVSMDLVARYENTKRVRPVVLGRSLFLTRETPDGDVRVYEVFKRDVDVFDRRDVTAHCPTFIQGTPYEMYGSLAQGILVLVTTTDSSTPATTRVWVYRFHDEGNRRVVSSWSEWTFDDAALIGSLMIGEEVGLISYYAEDTAIAWETMDLNSPPLSASSGKSRHMDRYVDSDDFDFSAADQGGGVTRFTLPYHLATDGSEGTLAAVRLDTFEVIDSADVTRPASNQVDVDAGEDLTSTDMAFGVLYEQALTPAPPYRRDQDGKPDTRARLTMKWLELHYHESTDITVAVDATGRSEETHTLDVASPTDGTLRVPVMAADYTFEITNSTPGACTLSSMDWEGRWAPRSRR